MRVAERINRERIVVLGWGRAILLQLAHPLVAAGVAEHSGFSSTRWSRLQRLHETVGAMVELTFGDAGQRARTAARINAIHDRVNGGLRDTVGRYPAGTPYSATDVDLLCWVHATLLDSIPLAYERFVGPLTDREKDLYCEEAVEGAMRLRVPEHRLPRNMRHVTRSLEERFADGTVVVGPQARAVARDLLYPPLTDPTRPVGWLSRLVTLGLLPPAVRSAYGFGWSSGRDRSLQIVSHSIRRLLPLMPGRARYWR
jgi:uncharacterized protein (DUF2236 family)